MEPESHRDRRLLSAILTYVADSPVFKIAFSALAISAMVYGAHLDLGRRR